MKYRMKPVSATTGGRLDPLIDKRHKLVDCSNSNCPSYVDAQSLCDRTFWWHFCLSLCPLDISVNIGVFVIGMIHISFFLML